jgi:hypothetical protein
MPTVNRPAEASEDPIVSAHQHILEQQHSHFPDADDTFPWLRSDVTSATKTIEAKVRRADLLDVLGSARDMNMQDETQQKLHVYANQALLHCLGLRDTVAILVSEESEEPVTFDRARETGKQVIFFDPLDGSSNIDVNVRVGTIFSIFRRPPKMDGGLQPAVLQTGLEAGCCQLRDLRLLKSTGTTAVPRRGRIRLPETTKIAMRQAQARAAAAQMEILRLRFALCSSR